jgi:SAM-dependent methyltransferase
VPVPDPIFSHPRLAQLYDALEGSRPDLDLYVELLADLGAGRVVDVGCGTGTLACALAARGLDVVGADPARASLAIARRKPYADQVSWQQEDAASLPELAADAATMTGNVAQVFVGDDHWAAALAGVRRALAPGGWLLFEARDPAAEAWRDWNRESSYQEVEVDGIGVVRSWVDTTHDLLPLVSFRWTFLFDDGTTLTSDSTLRFRTEGELERSLAAAGFIVSDVRDAPDRPGKELVFVAQRHDPVE